jgi:2-polyprenyl-3-methyl-5-hydroxy-6-metoxy-1,4-benzoquinol methylase
VLEGDQAEMAIPSYLNRNPLIRAIFWRRYDQVYRLAQLTTEMTVAEFGCGIGVFLPTLTRETSKVYAVDLFPQYAQEVAKRLDLDVDFSTSLDSIPDDSLDILFAVEVLEHLDDLPAGIQHIARKIKPGGRLIMSGPTENTLYKIGRFMVGYNKYHEYHRHNVYGIRQAIIENGFDLEQTVMFPNRLVLLNLICSFRVDK